MKRWGLERTGVLLSRCAYGVCLLVVGAALVLTAGAVPDGGALLLKSVPVALVLAAVLWGAGWLSERLDWRLVLGVLVAVCFVLRLFWVLHARIEPMGDYEVFHSYAARLAQEKTLGGLYTRYLALFPHIFGYSWFLSLLYKVFGPSPLAAAVANAVLSTLSCALVYLLAKRLGGVKAATGAALLWALFPSHIIYNMFVLSEPLYTALILAALLAAAVFDETAGRAGQGTCLGLGALAGLLLALVNLCRPVAVILILALLIWLGVGRLERWRERDWRRNAVCFVLALLFVYFAVGRLGTMYEDYRIGEKTASTPGYNILVGFNPRSEGTWNMEDSDLLYATDARLASDAAATQAEMLEAAKARISSGEVEIGKLFASKLVTFLGRDSVCVDYAATVLRHKESLATLCDLVWTATLLLALAGTVVALIRKDRGLLFPATLYLVGLTMAHMLVEVAPRYHYSLLIPLVFLAVRAVEPKRE